MKLFWWKSNYCHWCGYRHFGWKLTQLKPCIVFSFPLIDWLKEKIKAN